MEEAVLHETMLPVHPHPQRCFARELIFQEVSAGGMGGQRASFACHRRKTSRVVGTRLPAMVGSGGLVIRVLHNLSALNISLIQALMLGG